MHFNDNREYTVVHAKYIGSENRVMPDFPISFKNLMEAENYCRDGLVEDYGYASIEELKKNIRYSECSRPCPHWPRDLLFQAKADDFDGHMEEYWIVMLP